MGHVRVGHYILGVQGMALLRTWLTGSREQADRCARDLAAFAAEPDQPPLALELDVPETDVRTGYARWVTTYDHSPNALIHAEQPVVRALIDRLPPGRALDAACGTGRHTKHLHARGHTVVGVDTSAAMLEKARAELPQVDFRLGNLSVLPLEAGSVDLVVCALALTHCERLAPPINEFARVLRPGGRLLLSDLHPMLCALGMTAFFVSDDGGAGYVRSYCHLHSAYLSAFNAAGLDVEQCIEPVNGNDEVAMMSGGMMDIAGDAFRTAFLGLPQALIWQLVRR